jgi:hypothetical protein
MGQLLRMVVQDSGACFARDLSEGSSDPTWIASELDGRGIGKKLPLSRDGRLDEATQKDSDGSEDDEGEANQCGLGTSLSACPSGPAADSASSNREEKDPE